MGTSAHLTNNKILPECHYHKFRSNYIAVFDDSTHSFAAHIATLKNTKDDSTPFYIMNVDKVNEIMDIWLKHLPRIQPFYSLQCNSDPVFLQLLASNPSIGFNCASQKELQTAQKLSLSPDRIYSSNPCWTGPSLRQAAQQNVHLLSFESERDLDRILSNYPDVDLLLHICVNHESDDPSAQFGCPLESAPYLLQLAAELGLRCVGISFSVGIDFANPSILAQSIEWSAKLFRIGTNFGHNMNTLNIGDCFMSPLLSEWHYEKFSEQAAHLNQMLDAYGFSGNDIRVMATPGQFVASSVFTLVTNIIGKRSIDATFVTNNAFDAGSEAFLYQINEGYYGSFGCRIMANSNPQCQPLFNDQQNYGTDQQNIYGTIIGPMGFEDPEMDMVQPICHFQRQMHVGDWLIWDNMGAYTLGNCGSLEDEDGQFVHSDGTPTVFYFTSHDNWERFTLDSIGQQQPMDETDVESVGSCGEQMHTDSEDECEAANGPAEDDEDNFWMFGWPIC